ncbi:MAG TPA: ABC transporter ATP-binding protein [Solirubrobacteraceae bacterium]|nr:ABC transporter ATP-binding protein [Solirubrobacteraceae bacterium]
MAVLRASGLTKRVGSGRAQRQVLDGVSLTVDAGEVVAVLGRSGSGKSTLLHLLGGLDRPDGGEIRIAGERLTGRSARALARLRLHHIGFVFQQFQLIEECTGLENVLLPTRLPGAPRGGARQAARLVEELGLAGVADHLPHELSGGEQQRFALARALVNEPELVLADEPTGSLDAVSGAAVLDLLRGLRDRAVVIVTHEPEAAGIADRVLRLSDGRLADAVASGEAVAPGEAAIPAVRRVRRA